MKADPRSEIAAAPAVGRVRGNGPAVGRVRGPGLDDRRTTLDDRRTTGPDGRRAAPGVYLGSAHRRRIRRRRALLVCVLTAMLLASGTVVTAAVLAGRFDRAVNHADLLGDARSGPHQAVAGPLNFLLIGSNYRAWDPSNGERADSILIVHVPRSMDRAFLVSVPRDLYYTIKPYPPTHFGGSTEKIDAALNFGGMPLMSQSVADLTGLRFDGAVEARFDGFTKAVQVLGGVDMCVDEKTVSIHIGHDKSGKLATPYTETEAEPIPVPGVTPQVYYPGCQHLAAWQALDFVRQRELLPNGDYDRQRHQQQFLMAVLKQTTSAGTLSDPVKLDRVLQAIGKSLTVDTNGTSVADFIFALRGIKADSLVGLRTPSHPEMIGDTSYVIGDPDMDELWQAIRDDTLADYAAAHPQDVNSLHNAVPAARK
ncbi:LCP family protein [Dactylosporangium sp. NPDC048998]|uniref:LCP family protein n=1 Tax=Dactylosporangium sp. NPDC048998 TaxID=3363976 RepID=UPI00371301D7